MKEEFQGCVAEQLFRRPFWVIVPNWALVKPEVVELFGTFTTNDPIEDMEIVNHPTPIELPITLILEHYLQGVPIKVVQVADIPIMYGLVNHHLSNWHSIIVNSLNVEHPPLDDFMRLDDFCSELYAYSKEMSHGNLGDGTFKSKLNTGRMSKYTLIKDNSTATDRVKTFEGVFTEPSEASGYDSFGKKILQLLARRRSRGVQ